MNGYFLAVTGDGQSSSVIAGSLVWALVLAIGLYKCISIGRRERTSTICVMSLALALVCFLLPVFIRVLEPLMPESDRWMLAAAIGLLLLMASVSGLVLGIVGLTMYRGGFIKGGQVRSFSQGRKQAGWGIALNVVFILLFGGAVVASLSVRRGALDVLHQVQAKQGQDFAGSSHTFDDLNFQLTMPSGNWVKMNPQSIVQDSCLVLVRQRPQIYVSVIAEKLGVEANLSPDKLAEIAKSNLMAVNPSASISDDDFYAHSNLGGHRFTADLSLNNMDFTYQWWCYANNGYAYQIIMWSSAGERTKLEQCADEVFAGFEQLEPERRCYQSGNNPFGICRSDNFPYSVQLEQTDWLRWSNPDQNDPLPEMGGHHPDDIWFNVSPIYLPVDGAAVDQVRQGFLNLYQVGDESICSPPEPLHIDGVEGSTYAFESNGYRYREYVLVASNAAYLVSVWCTVDKAKDLRTYADEVMGGFRVHQDEEGSGRVQRPSGEERSNQALAINQIGLTYYAAGRYPESLEWFRCASEFDPDDADYFGNVLAAYRNMGRNEEGLAFLADGRDSPCRSTPQVRSLEASLLVALGRADEAGAIYSDIFAAGYRDDEDFISWTRLRAENGQWDDLDAIFADYLTSSSPVDLRIHQMDLYWSKGDYQRVADLAEESEEKYGFSPAVAYWAIDAYQELGLYNEALEVCSELLDRNYASVKVYHEKAASEYGLKWYRQAKATLEEALKLNPHNEDTQEWLQLVSAELGEGSNSVLKESIDPVILPAGVEELLYRDVPEGFGEEFGAFYERLAVLWEYRKGERLRRTDRQRIRLLDNTGVSSFSSLEFTFSPLSQKIFVNQLLVRNEEGEIVSRGVVKDYYVTDDSSDGLISEDKQLVIPVPGLQPGYSIDIEITRDYPAAPEEFYFERHYLAAGVPVLAAAVWLGGESGDVGAVALNAVDSRSLDEGRLWLGREPYSYRWEPRQTPIESFVPAVVLGSKGESWQACSTEYLEKIVDRLGSDESVRGEVDTLIRECANDEERFISIVNWLRSTFTYKPLEFGRSAYMPDCAADTLAYRYGDCKDLSVLLMEMLNAAGIEAHLALVNSSSRVYPDIFTTDQFDHMIVYLPGFRGGIFVDPTDQEMDPVLSVPLGLRDHHALVLDPDNIQLKSIPDYAVGSSRCDVSRSLGVDGRQLRIQDRVQLHGYCASWMRGVLKEQQRINWVQWFQQNVAAFVPDLEVMDVSASGVTDNSEDLILEVSFILRHAVQEEEDDALSVNMPSIWPGYYLSARIVPDRQNPFCINYPFELNLTTAIQPPDGYRLNEPIVDESETDSPYLVWRAGSPGAACGQFNASLKTGEFAAAEYADYVSKTDAAVKDAQLKFHLEKTAESTGTLTSTDP